ncbi:hypothetical protein ACFSVJ_03135 [Prauserella oleivorans]
MTVSVTVSVTVVTEVTGAATAAVRVTGWRSATRIAPAAPRRRQPRRRRPDR